MKILEKVRGSDLSSLFMRRPRPGSGPGGGAGGGGGERCGTGARDGTGDEGRGKWDARSVGSIGDRFFGMFSAMLFSGFASEV